MNEEEMEQVSGGRKYIVYDENGKEVRRTLSEAIARMEAAGRHGTYEEFKK